MLFLVPGAAVHAQNALVASVAEVPKKLSPSHRLFLVVIVPTYRMIFYKVLS